MRALRYTLLADGSSDRCLLNIIDWILRAIPRVEEVALIPQSADLRNLPSPPSTLRERIPVCLRYFPCDVLFVHRDAEGEPLESRRDEICAAVTQTEVERFVPVIPVRMTEAWLLTDEDAIRFAAGNPNGEIVLALPGLDRLESLPDPKEKLKELLLLASESRGRRRDRFKRDLSQCVQRVAELTADFSALRRLNAFREFEQRTREVFITALQ